MYKDFNRTVRGGDVRPAILALELHVGGPLGTTAAAVPYCRRLTMANLKAHASLTTAEWTAHNNRRWAFGQVPPVDETYEEAEASISLLAE